MPNALELARRYKENKLTANHAYLVYGETKTGKTALLGTIAKLPECKRLFFFDLENGVSTIFNPDVGLTDEELSKIEIISIEDTKQRPSAILTVGKALTNAEGASICEKHGRESCPDCLKAKLPLIKFKLSDLGPGDWVVIDSGSQLGESALNFVTKDRPVEYKLSFNDYGDAGRLLHNIFSTVQQATHCKFVVATHTIDIGEGEDGTKNVKTYPWVGTRNFSKNVGKYFGTVIFTDKKLNKHIAGSSSTYSPRVLTGSRLGLRFEDLKEVSFLELLGSKTGTEPKPATKLGLKKSL